MKTLISLAQSGRINNNASIRDKQSTIINAPSEDIWRILTDVENWSTWNQDIAKVRAENIEPGSGFQWIISGKKYEGTFRKVDKNHLLSWTASTLGVKTIQVWTLEPADGNQTIVSTEESRQGFGTIFFSHLKLHSMLLNWLARIKQHAENSSI